MPNWTENTVTIRGSKNDLDKIEKKLKSKKTVFDFNKIVPMPKSLDVTAGSMTDEAILVYLTDKLSFKPNKRTKESEKIYKLVTNCFSKDWPKDVYERVETRGKERIDELYDLGKQYVYNYDNYGCATWYEWCTKNWGTKWNACDVNVYRTEDELEYTFNTAWDAPRPVIEALADKYPDVHICHVYVYDGDENEFYDEYN